MQFEPPSSPYPPNPFSPYGGYYPTPPPPNFARAHTFYEYPTPAPSPRTPQHSRRRSHDYTTTEFPGMRRAAAHDHSEYNSHDYATPPPRPHTRAGAAYMHTPLHTPPPTSHGGHGAPPPFFSSYMPSFPQADYFSPFPGHGPQSPPPRDRTRSARSHRRESTWAAGEAGSRSPPRTSSRRSKTTGHDAPVIDPEEHRAEAAKHGIPPDYSLKNWDPKERPIILLGSVFDANSLGEWIFNWTKFHHSRFHRATETAGKLWELLILLSSKLKRAIEFYRLIARQDNQEIVSDFIESGDRLWQKLKTLLSACEKYMWNGAKSNEKGIQMGRKSGAEFVDAMFNEDKEWDSTEKLMRGVRTWCDRFDINCEEILRNPDA